MNSTLSKCSFHRSPHAQSEVFKEEVTVLEDLALMCPLEVVLFKFSKNTQESKQRCFQMLVYAYSLEETP